MCIRITDDSGASPALSLVEGTCMLTPFSQTAAPAATRFRNRPAHSSVYADNILSRSAYRDTCQMLKSIEGSLAFPRMCLNDFVDLLEYI